MSTVRVPNFEAKIREALAEYLTDPTRIDLDTELTVLARGLGALPVHADMGGVLLIRPSGEVVVVHSNQEWTERAECDVVTDPEWISHSYDSCIRHYPKLREAIEELRTS